ncbi:MAG: hypothetical protein C0501_19280 [Isosphaera sp.]|nr:hypothetical protein [Isosphaera sp.]
MEIESPEQDLGDHLVGQSEVVFRVTNPSDLPAEVVSVTEGCGRMCCLKPMTADRLSIPPGGSAEVKCELVVIGPEPFEFTGYLYLNDNGLRTVKIAVRGTGVRPGAGNAPK